MRLRWEVKEKNLTPKTQDGEMESANTQRPGKSGPAAQFSFFSQRKVGGDHNGTEGRGIPAPPI